MGPITNGTSVSELLIFTGEAVAGDTVTVLNGTTVIGTAIANNLGVWTLTTSGLTNGTYNFTATATDATGTSAPSATSVVNVVPDVTAFSPVSDTQGTTIDNWPYVAQNANKAWSITNPDTHTLRFEMRGGDLWAASGSARSEVAGYPKMIPNGDVINISYQLKVEAGAAVPTTNQWVILGQLHGNDNAWQPSPAWPNFSIQLTGPNGLSGGDHLAVQADYAVQGVDTRPHALGTNGYLYVDPNSITRDHYYNVQVQMKLDNTSNGFLEVWLDGTQVVDYHGPLGYGGGTYWKEGIYRDQNDTYTMAADFKNLEVATAPAAPAIVSFSPDTGTIGDMATTASVITLTGKANANSQVTVFDGATQLGTATVDAHGAWNFTTPTLSSGTHGFTATDLDAHGAVSGVSSVFDVSVNASTTTPAVSSIVESPSSGDLNVGKTVTLTLNFSEAVTVAGGTPTLSLNDGGSATYTGGSGTSALSFSYTVAAGQNTAALAATAVNLNGATVKDGSGTAANLSLSGLTQTGPQIDTWSNTNPQIE